MTVALESVKSLFWRFQAPCTLSLSITWRLEHVTLHFSDVFALASARRSSGTNVKERNRIPTQPLHPPQASGGLMTHQKMVPLIGTSAFLSAAGSMPSPCLTASQDHKGNGVEMKESLGKTPSQHLISVWNNAMAVSCPWSCLSPPSYMAHRPPAHHCKCQSGLSAVLYSLSSFLSSCSTALHFRPPLRLHPLKHKTTTQHTRRKMLLWGFEQVIVSALARRCVKSFKQFFF